MEIKLLIKLDYIMPIKSKMLVVTNTMIYTNPNGTVMEEVVV